MRAAALLVAAIAALALGGCGGADEDEQGDDLVVVVNAPFSRLPSLGETIARGAELGARVVNAGGGVVVDGTRHDLRVVRRDNALSAATAVRNVRRAVRDGAVAVVDEGTGLDASWRVANDANLPIAIVWQGGESLVDPDERPNVFRIAPTDRGISFRLAEYLIPKGLRIALLTDDSSYGQEGAKALARAFGRNPEAVAARIRLATGVADVAPQVLRARSAGATALLVWAQPATVAAVVTAARSARWDVPVYTPPSGEDPLLRQQLADHPDWIDGLTFASGRMTAELGPQLFYDFKSLYETTYGPDDVGVRTSAGQRVVQPPDYAMYPYDFVRVLAAAITAAGSTDRGRILAALEEVSVQGANGDERGFNERSHEGVVDDDVYFAQFRDMTYRPVGDDPLSATLPVIEQTRPDE